MQYERCYRLDARVFPAGEAKKVLRQIQRVEAAAVTTPDGKGIYYVAFVTGEAADAFEEVLKTRQVDIDKREALPAAQQSSGQVQGTKSSSFGDSFSDGVVGGILTAIIDGLFDW